ncbi:MAG: HD-GYP domain-containing protein [Nitrospinae bacterium]|nr:HD-GYP domain-containing protein [Nitrospinota bacterium]
MLTNTYENIIIPGNIREKTADVSRGIKFPAVVITFALSLSVAILIILLAARVVDFSAQVTEHYAPTIHGVKSLAEAVGHVRAHIEKDGTLDQTTLLHFKEATERLRKLSSNWFPAYMEHIDGMLKKAEKILSELPDKNFPGEFLPDLRALNGEALKHVVLHDAELEKARIGIKNSAMEIRMAALAMLLAGAIFSFREFQMRRLRELEKEKLAAIKAFVSALEARDPYTKGHSVRVADYAALIGKKMGLKKETLEHLNIAALMHDIGKIAVPDGILRKAGKLSDEEWKEMRNHPVVSARTLETFDSLKNILPWTLYHHERFDGKGYPEGKAGMDIPLPARIIALADAFDAMTSDRAYRKALPVESALSALREGRGSQFDPRIVDGFLELLSLTPPAS